jgi:Fur family ferric uptake transcriptional regulator
MRKDEAQRRRWTFYEVVKKDLTGLPPYIIYSCCNSVTIEREQMEPIHHQEKEQFNRLFEDEGIDRIEDRLAILEAFLAIEEHISFQELIIALKRNGYRFEPDFVKKTLNLLCRYGFATKKQFEGQPTLYEHRHLGLHHDHLICTKCGKILEFESRQMEDLQVEIAALHGFHVLQHKTEIYGLCSDCLKERIRLMPLSFAQEGELGIVWEFMGGAGAQLRLATIGLRKGDEVEVVTNSGAGQLVVAVNGTRLALGRGIAKKIMVKPNGRRK